MSNSQLLMDVDVAHETDSTLIAPRGPEPAIRQEPLSRESNSDRSQAAWDFHAKESPPHGFTIVPAGNRSGAYLICKRLTDVIGSVALLLLLSPVMLITLIVLVITTRGRPIFCQERLGFCGRPFRMYKFRTMVLGAANQLHLVQNEQSGPVFKNRVDPRITRIGRVLRSFSIDETPQLLNVLLGQMSLVGPRPPLASEVARYEPWQRQRLAVKPGLTCLWQVAGRSQIGFEDWVRMDLWYLENQAVTTDIVLLLRTPWSVLSRRGAY